MTENMNAKKNIKLKSEKLEDMLDLVKSDEKIKELTKNLKPAEIAVNAGKDFVEIKIILTKNGIRDIKE